MITLQPKNAAQTAYFSPFQARKFFTGTHSTYLFVLTNYASDEEHKCILNVQLDNDRYTLVNLPTNNANPLGGSLLLEDTGLYTYTIYSQSSLSNLDPDAVSVNGICEIGVARVGTQVAWTTPTIPMPDNVIYY
jgi:hypothetical protein